MSLVCSICSTYTTNSATQDQFEHVSRHYFIFFGKELFHVPSNIHVSVGKPRRNFITRQHILPIRYQVMFGSPFTSLSGKPDQGICDQFGSF